jgi:hypothetical protein
MDDNEGLNYTSSLDAFAPEKDKPSVDVADEKALERLVGVVEGQIELYNTLDGVKQFDKDLPLQMRFELCNHYIQLLYKLLGLINNAIAGIKEKGK